VNRGLLAASSEPILACETLSARFRAGGLACVALLGGGCLPSRDNPHDPVNAPTVSARVADFTDASGRCPIGPFVEQSNFTFVESASRGRCLAIDARATTDERGRLAGAGWRFRYFVLTSDGEPAVELPADDPPTTATLDAETRRSLQTNEALLFRLDVADPDGNLGSTDVSFVLLNSRPMAQTVSQRVVEAGGPPWAPVGQLTLEFSGAKSADTDGDPLSVCWTFPGEAETCGAFAEPPAVPAPTSRPVMIGTPGRFLATLRAWDNALYSEPVFASVDVSRPSVWTSSPNFPRADRYDGATGIADVSAPGALVGIAAAPTGPGRAALVYVTGSDAYLTEGAIGGTFPAGIYLAPVGLDQNADGVPDLTLATDPELQKAYVMVSGGTVFVVDLTTDPFTTSAVSLAPLPPMRGGYLLEADGAGGVWIADHDPTLFAPIGLGFLERLDETNEIAVLATNDRIDFTSLARRPGTREMWISSVSNPGASTIPATPGLFVYDADQPLNAPVALPVGDDGVSGIAWVDEVRLWVALPGSLHLVDADALAAGVPIDLAGRSVESLEGVTLSALVVDPQTGDCIAVGLDPVIGGSVLFRVSTAGSIVRTDSPPFARVDMIAPDGRLISETLGPLTLAFGLGLSPANVVHGDFVFDGLGYDTATGGLWAMMANPYGLARFSPGSELLQYSTSVLEEGTPRPFPMMGRVALSPDGSVAYGFEGPSFGRLLAIDLGSDPAMRVLDPGPGASTDYRILRPSAPLPATTPFLWVHAAPQQGGTISQLDPISGPPDVPIFTTQPGEFVDAMDLAPASNDLCVSLALQGVSDLTVRQVRLTPEGSSDVLMTETRIDFLISEQGTIGGHTANDACFFYENFDEPSGRVRVLGWDSAGTLIADEYLVGLGKALDGVVSDGSVWLVMQETTSMQRERMLLLAIGATPGTATVFLSDHVLDSSAGTRTLVRY